MDFSLPPEILSYLAELDAEGSEEIQIRKVEGHLFGFTGKERRPA